MKQLIDIDNIRLFMLTETTLPECNLAELIRAQEVNHDCALCILAQLLFHRGEQSQEKSLRRSAVKDDHLELPADIEEAQDQGAPVHPQPSLSPEEVKCKVLPNAVPLERVDDAAISPSTGGGHDDALVSFVVVKAALDIIYPVHPQPSYTPEEVESTVQPNAVPEEPVDDAAVSPGTGGGHDDAMVITLW